MGYKLNFNIVELPISIIQTAIATRMSGCKGRTYWFEAGDALLSAHCFIIIALGCAGCYFCENPVSPGDLLVHTWWFVEWKCAFSL